MSKVSLQKRKAPFTSRDWILMRSKEKVCVYVLLLQCFSRHLHIFAFIIFLNFCALKKRWLNEIHRVWKSQEKCLIWISSQKLYWVYLLPYFLEHLNFRAENNISAFWIVDFWNIWFWRENSNVFSMKRSKLDFFSTFQTLWIRTKITRKVFEFSRRK